jgi:hypothetical protein
MAEGTLTKLNLLDTTKESLIGFKGDTLPARMRARASYVSPLEDESDITTGWKVLFAQNEHHRGYDLFKRACIELGIGKAYIPLQMDWIQVNIVHSSPGNVSYTLTVEDKTVGPFCYDYFEQARMFQV